MDYGCGRQPYRGIVEAAGGDYHPYDRVAYPANISGKDVGDLLDTGYDAILCNQVIQYVPDVEGLLWRFRMMLVKRQGVLLMTGPTNWPIVEREDRCRFTPNGIETLLRDACFRNITVEGRATVDFQSESWLVGWGAVAWA